jgi:hypothetical protein
LVVALQVVLVLMLIQLGRLQLAQVLAVITQAEEEDQVIHPQIH